MADKNLIVNETLIEDWKLKYKSIHKITVNKPNTDVENEEVQGQQFSAIFRKPDLVILSAYTTLLEQSKIQGLQVLFDNCWLGGDAEILEDDELKLSVMNTVAGLFQTFQTEMVKL